MWWTHLLIAYLFVGVAQTGPASPNQSLVQAIHDAYSANQSSFEHGEITFEFIKGEAKGDDDVRAGNLKSAKSLLGFYAFNTATEEARLDSVFPEKTMRQNSRMIGSDTIQSTLTSFRVITNGEVSVSEILDVHPNRPGFLRSMMMLDGKDFFLQFFDLPLSLGQPAGQQADNLSFRLRHVLDGNPDYSVAEMTENESFEGRPVVKLVIDSPLGRYVYLVDMERGAIPLMTEFQRLDGNKLRLASLTFNDDLVNVTGHGWLPFHRSWRHVTSGDSGYQRIIETKFNRPPDRKALGLEFDEPVGLINQSKSLSYKPRKFWDLATLPAAGSPAVTKSPPSSSIPMDQVPQLPGEQRQSPNYLLMALGLIAVVAAIIGGFWLRGINK